MSKAPDPSVPEGATDRFKHQIEERYDDWEREFGDDIQQRRTTSFDPKQ
jgi:hypothetical protein